MCLGHDVLERLTRLLPAQKLRRVVNGCNGDDVLYEMLLLLWVLLLLLLLKL